MQVLGILARTRSDKITEVGFRHAEEILKASCERGHIFIDIKRVDDWLSAVR